MTYGIGCMASSHSVFVDLIGTLSLIYWGARILLWLTTGAW
jgi:hypothetical protein